MNVWQRLLLLFVINLGVNFGILVPLGVGFLLMLLIDIILDIAILFLIDS